MDLKKLNKKNIREEIIDKRNNLILDIKQNYDSLIFEEIINSEIYKKSKKIFTYISFGSEVDTIKLINYSFSNNKEVYVPKINKQTKDMIALKIHNFNNMSVDKWGIIEPNSVDKTNIGTDFDLIIMPGIAFDKQGNRIGYGGGYYDKYISKLNNASNLLALAYDFQIIQDIESESHDIKVDFILTNKGFIKVNVEKVL